MDGFEEKKWYVWVDNRHEGPFSLADIESKMQGGQVTSSSFIWADGMADWQAMAEVAAFEAIVHKPNGNGPNGRGVADSGPEIAIELPTLVPASSLSGAQMTAAIGPGVDSATGSISVEAVPMGPITGEVPDNAPPVPATKTRSRLIYALLVATVLAALAFFAVSKGYLDPLLSSPYVREKVDNVSNSARPYLFKVMERVPAITRWVSPIPRFEGVSPEEYEELKSVASGAPEPGKAIVALALSRQDLVNPAFYVSSNMPDGAKFDVYVEGVPDTLLNQLSFFTKAQTTINTRWGKTLAIKLDGGMLIPRGEYVIRITESPDQTPEAKSLLEQRQPVSVALPDYMPKGAKTILTKTYFLGGLRDDIYVARLKEFHDKLMAKAKAELTELRLFSETLEKQLNETSTVQSSLRKGKTVTLQGKVTVVQKRKWNEFHSRFESLMNHMAETFDKWTSNAPSDEYFYGSIYTLVKQAGQAVSSAHGVHHGFFSGVIEPKAFEIKSGETTSAAQAAILALKSKIDQAEKLSPTPNGMPRRDGL